MRASKIVLFINNRAVNRQNIGDIWCTCINRRKAYTPCMFTFEEKRIVSSRKSANPFIFLINYKNEKGYNFVVPVGVPLVTVDKTGLENGRPLIADCHAPPSYPAANITLYVNDERVPGYTSEWITPVKERLQKKTGRLELSGVGGSWGALRLRCEATLFRLYRANSLEVEVRPDTPQPASILLMGPSGGGCRLATLPLLRLHILVVLILSKNWMC